MRFSICCAFTCCVYFSVLSLLPAPSLLFMRAVRAVAMPVPLRASVLYSFGMATPVCGAYLLGKPNGSPDVPLLPIRSPSTTSNAVAPVPSNWPRSFAVTALLKVDYDLPWCRPTLSTARLGPAFGFWG